MLRRITAQQALLRLQDISAHCSDGEYPYSELDYVLTNDVEVEFDSSEKVQMLIALAKTMNATHRIKRKENKS